MLKFFDAYLGSGIFSTQDPGFGMEKFGSGIRDGKIRIRDRHPGSATLPHSIVFIFSLEFSTTL
jgi:hypothetical protein